MFQRKNALVWYVAAMALVLPGTTQAAELLTNGNFSSGLAGWTTFNTPNGSSSPMATTFDITGAGVQSAVGLNVGQHIIGYANK